MLVEQIAPRLRSAIPKCVQTIGAEDPEELVQDAILVAAMMLQRLEVSGKTVTAGNIAYYTILHMKAGRRSYGASRADAMAPGTQVTGRSSVLSLEEEVGYDPEVDEAITLEQVLESHQEDPALAASRNVDWALFLLAHDGRYRVIVKRIVEGRSLTHIAHSGQNGYSQIYQLRDRLAEDLRAFMGEEAIADSARLPSWKSSVMVDRERAACQAARRKP